MKHNLYIIKASNNKGECLIKFGYSSKIDERINQYLSHNPFTEVLYTFYKKDAFIFEQKFHTNNIPTYKYEWYTYDKLDEILLQIKNNKIIENKNICNRKNYTNVDAKCFKCKQRKEFKYFSKDKSKPSGLCNICKECEKIKNKNYRLKSKI